MRLRLGLSVCLVAGLSFLAVGSGPGPQALHAQLTGGGGEGCDLAASERLNSIMTADEQRITYISGPVVFQCDDGTTIRADSVVDFSSNQFRQLIGSVVIDGPATRLLADRVHRSDAAGRTQAWGAVELEDRETETHLSGDTLVILEADSLRMEDRITVTGGRPRAILRIEGEEAPDTMPDPDDGPQRIVIGRDVEPEDTVTLPPPPPPPPDTVIGDRIYLEGESRFAAAGDVRVLRPDMEARADSLDYDRALSLAALMGADTLPARLEGEEFDLEAPLIELLIQGNRVNEVRARDDALLTGQDVVVDAPRVRILMSDGQVDEMVAIGEPSGPDEADVEAPGPESPVPAVQGSRRAEALAEEFLMRADSIRVSAPGRVLERVTAVGDARGESMSRDSLNTPDTPDLIRRDWIEGDTIVAHFLPGDPVAEEEPAPAEGESRAQYRLDRLVAMGNARSLYRMSPNDSVEVVEADAPEADDDGQEAEAPPDPGAPVAGEGDGGAAPTSPGSSDRPRMAVHYVLGDRITILMSEGQVERMEVQGQTRGIYLEPRAGRTRPPGAAGTPADEQGGVQ